jgi:hypothetical protein
MNPQVSLLETVAAGFGELLEKVVFVGGIVTSLYMDSPSASEPRPTEDVDCVVEALTYVASHELGPTFGGSDPTNLDPPLWV